MHTCSKRQMLTGLPGPRSPMETADHWKKELKAGYTGAVSACECPWHRDRPRHYLHGVIYYHLNISCFGRTFKSSSHKKAA